MTIDEIRELINLAQETGVAELEVQRGENKVRIRRSLGSTQEVLLQEVAARAGVVPNPGPAAPAPAPAAPPVEPVAEDNLVMVKSPIVGTFYESPSPGSPPFVQPGDVVHPGQVLCIIESMKLMNEIEAEVAGTVVKKLVGNAQPVEYGEALYAIRPA